MNTFNSDKEVVKLKAFSESRIIGTPSQYERVPVLVTVHSKVLETYASELYSEWDAASQVVGRVLPFTADELRSYIHQLIKIRVDYVNGHRVLVNPMDNTAVPSFLSLVLSNLGLARDASYGVELFPELTDEVKVELDFIQRMSRSIRMLGQIGVEYAEGYTRNRDGSYEFMSMTLIDNYVRSWTKESHPVYALLASTLGIKGIEAVLSPRITYGHVDHMASLIRNLVTVRG